MEEDRPHRSRLRRRISSWANSSDQHARDLRKTYARPGQVSIADAPDREQVRLSGTVRSVTLRPRGGVPALEAELDDGSGVVTLIWLGRRRILGVSAGRSIAVRGRIGVQDNDRVIFNPRYELLP
ncbi:OB-fold nucleic acid binding domain-containing protein [Nocardioides sp. Bht2]|uniref:OB-fold nucleic acid binding domain-containing protein n=1 Tax=Nocardioides sp. Bht2 TaxID=3392297 RepID=UPI0039B67DBD